MPTGYTAYITEKDFNFEKWIKTIIPRAMGFMISYRDDSLAYKDENILLDGLKKSKNTDVKYHTDKLKKAQKTLEEIQSRSDKEWKSLFEKNNKLAIKNNAKNEKKFNENKKKHLDVRDAIEKLIAKAPDEITRNTLVFALSQVNETLDFDYRKLYKEHVFESVEEYKKSTTNSAFSDIEYHAKNLKEQHEPDIDYYTAYQQYLKFINENLEKK